MGDGEPGTVVKETMLREPAIRAIGIRTGLGHTKVARLQTWNAFGTYLQSDVDF